MMHGNSLSERQRQTFAAAGVIAAASLLVVVLLGALRGGVSNTGFLLLWLGQAVFGLLCGWWLMESGWLYSAKEEKAPEPAPQEGRPGYGAAMVYYAPQTLDHEAEKPAPPADIPPTALRVTPGVPARAAFVLGILCTLLPSLFSCKLAVLSLGLLSTAPEQCAAGRRLAWAGLGMAGASVFGYILLSGLA